MATETNRKTDGTQINSISSIVSDMKTMLDDFRQGLPDCIDQIIRNWMSRMLSPFLLT